MGSLRQHLAQRTRDLGRGVPVGLLHGSQDASMLRLQQLAPTQEHGVLRRSSALEQCEANQRERSDVEPGPEPAVA